MPASLPPADQFRNAMDIYLHSAYPGTPPLRVRSLLDVLRTWAGDFWKAPLFVTEPKGEATRYTVRLGNDFYPHMKMVIELSPDQSQYFYRVDTHDRHCCPQPTSPEYQPFCELMERNQKMAEKIEAAWEAVQLPTFKQFLREDLKRRQAAAG